MLNKYNGLRREEYPLPSTKTSDIVDAVQQALSLDGVFKIVVESGQPMLVYRKRGDDPLDEDDVTLDGALRNSEIIEYDVASKSSLEVIFGMLQRVGRDRLYPICWATGLEQEGVLRHWTNQIDKSIPDLGILPFGIPVVRVKTLPEDTIILCAAARHEGDYQDVVVGIKAIMETHHAVEEKRTSSTSDNQVGSDTGECPPPTGTVETTTVRGGKGSWHPTSLAGIRMGDRSRVRGGT